MSSKTARKQEVAKIASELAANMVKAIDKEPDSDDLKEARLAKKDIHGNMLLCEFTLQKKAEAPDPLVITVNDEIKWVKRGAKVKLPWYFVEHMLHNVERKYHSVPDPADPRKRIVSYDDMPTEGFSYRPIDPAPGVDIEGPKNIEPATM